MKLAMACLALWVGLALAGSARAHDGPHGVGLSGAVVSLAGDVLTLKTAKSDVAVTLMARTRIRSGEQPAARDALVPGTCVHVHGSKLPGGGFAAREVEIELQEGDEKPLQLPVPAR